MLRNIIQFDIENELLECIAASRSVCNNSDEMTRMMTPLSIYVYIYRHGYIYKYIVMYMVYVTANLRNQLFPGIPKIYRDSLESLDIFRNLLTRLENPG